MDWRSRFHLELEHAERARANGNEGRARVCARRAAGIAAAEYYRRRGLASRGASTLDLLKRLMAEPSLAAEAYALIDHLVVPVDSDFKLPAGIDLVLEARRLQDLLLPD